MNLTKLRVEPMQPCNGPGWTISTDGHAFYLWAPKPGNESCCPHRHPERIHWSACWEGPVDTGDFGSGRTLTAALAVLNTCPASTEAVRVAFAGAAEAVTT